MSVQGVIDSFRILLAAVLIFLMLTAAPAEALGQSNPVRFVAEITFDDDGRALHYPSALFFDRGEDEIFLVNGGRSRVVVYGPDLFPRGSIGAGRGVDAPRGVFVTSDGTVYICQSRTPAQPHPRITILNGAFFIDREILLQDIPGGGNFSPSRMVVTRDGLIYLAGEATRGVMVLDNEGTFLRMLRPMDTIADREAIEAAAREREKEEESRRAKEEEDVSERTVRRADIPEEFRPRSRQQGEAPSGPGLGPVRVRNVSTDSAGNLYLVSAETSKIYVYGPDETFLFSFGEKGGTPRKLSQPRGIAVDENRKLIYVADYMRHTILAFDFTGRYVFEFGGRGFGPGWFNFPSDLAMNRQGQLIVTDLFNQRVQILEIEFAGGSFPMFQDRRATTQPPAVADPVEEPMALADRPGVPEGWIDEEVVEELEPDGEYPESGSREPNGQHPESGSREPGEI